LPFPVLILLSRVFQKVSHFCCSCRINHNYTLIKKIKGRFTSAQICKQIPIVSWNVAKKILTICLNIYVCHISGLCGKNMSSPGVRKFRRINECINICWVFWFYSDHSKCLTAALAPKSSPLVQQSHLHPAGPLRTKKW